MATPTRAKAITWNIARWPPWISTGSCIEPRWSSRAKAQQFLNPTYCRLHSTKIDFQEGPTNAAHRSAESNERAKDHLIFTGNLLFNVDAASSPRSRTTEFACHGLQRVRHHLRSAARHRERKTLGQTWRQRQGDLFQ